MTENYDLDLLERMLDADAAYQAADAASRAFHDSEAAKSLKDHFLASGGWISTFPDQDAVLRWRTHEENRQRETDRVILEFLTVHDDATR